MTMEVILLEKVQNLGDLGDVVSVKPGYGRNYLIPEGKAAPATAENRALFEARRADLEKAAADALETANTRRAAVEGKTVTIAVRAGEEGKMFGSVGPVDIVEALAAMDISVQKSEVRLHTGPIRQLGTYEVEVYLHPEVSANVTIAVVAEQ
jgi:large subunit ribosomal protein L9